MSYSPSNSNIKTYSEPLIEGDFDDVKQDCINAIEKLKENRKFCIGYASEKYARPRFKKYEEHGDFDVKEIFLIYLSHSKFDAKKMEGYLISYFHDEANNMNIRIERNFGNDFNKNDYFVYLAID
jgi:hypothetical protein